MPEGSTVIETSGVDQTKRLACCLGECCEGGEVIALNGELGAGKTQFAKGLAAGLGIDRPEHLTSPTFVIINEYPGRLTFYHIDAYRLGGAGDLEDLGIEEIITAGGVTAIEWAEKVAECIPEDALSIRMDITSEHKRTLVFSWNDEVAGRLVLQTQNAFSI